MGKKNTRSNSNDKDSGRSDGKDSESPKFDGTMLLSQQKDLEILCL